MMVSEKIVKKNSTTDDKYKDTRLIKVYASIVEVTTNDSRQKNTAISPFFLGDPCDHSFEQRKLKKNAN